MFSIMIVDDREIFRRQFKRFPVFREADRFQVTFEAQNGQEALEILRKEKVDLLITDIRMPIMDGLELLCQAKKEKLCPCIVLLSEYSDFSYAKQGIVLGAFDYIVKPIDQEVLKELLKRCGDHLDSIHGEVVWHHSEMRVLPGLLLKNDGYADEVAKRMADRILSSSLDRSEIMKQFAEIMWELEAQIRKEIPYMERYLRFDRLFALDQAEEFCARIHMIRKSINQFAVDTKNDLLRSACNIVVRNIEDDLSLQSVAKLLFVNKAYLSHLFKQELGISFIDYLVTVKMERAKYLLCYSGDKIYEISRRLGYGDTEYFSRVFKQSVGKTPTEYRNESQGGEAGRKIDG